MTRPESQRVLTSLPVVLLSFALLLGAAGAAAETNWRGFRGGPDAPVDVLPETFGLTVDWKRELGSGYSTPSLQDGAIVATFTAGDEDVLAVFDAATGEERWRLSLGEKYAGHDGSADGPLSVPALDGDRIFALSGHGLLLAADLNSGGELWRVTYSEANSSVPFYGYSASPVVVDDLVVMLVGGEDRAVVAYDKASGEQRWATGTDTVTYQTPIVATFGGQRQIVAVTDQWVRGLDPADGAELWSHRIQTGEQREVGSHPLVLDDQHLLIDLSIESLALRIDGGDRWTITEVWRSRAFSNNFVPPVVHDGTLFGFTGRILTAASAETGEILWRSRAVRGPNLTLVDGHLAVLSREGELVIFEASSADYVEKARVQVFENGDFPMAIFGGGRFYVRNLAELAAVNVDSAAAPAVADAEVDPLRHLGAFGAFIQTVEALPEAERQARVDSYFAAVRQMPIVEADGSAHLIYRGDVADVAIHGTLLGWNGEERGMHRVDGTDLFYRSFQLHPEGVYNYMLAVDFGQPEPDPANPNDIQGFVHASELRLPMARVNHRLVAPADGAPRGELHTFRIHSETLDNFRDVRVWTPPGFGGGGGHGGEEAEAPSYPLLVVSYGHHAVDAGHMDHVLDHLVGGGQAAPMVVAFVPRQDFTEYNGDQAAGYATFLATELVPHLERHYQATGAKAIMGPASAGVASLRTALAHPGIFGKVAVQSFYLTDADRDEFTAMIEAATDKPEVWVDTGPNDYQIENSGIYAERSSKALVEKLGAEGFTVHRLTNYGTASWAGWRI
ncbi:MAG: PQQ-binding-like beta-propeller repeat protein, partial [Acidobacteriota bacterium]